MAIKAGRVVLKIHMASPSGKSILCTGRSLRGNALLATSKPREVTCLTCLKRLYQLPSLWPLYQKQRRPKG